MIRRKLSGVSKKGGGDKGEKRREERQRNTINDTELSETRRECKRRMKERKGRMRDKKSARR